MIEKAKALRFAYILGKISPNINIIVVIIPTSIISNTIGFSKDSKNILLREENKSTIAILIKLLATKMVANKRLGVFKSDITRWIAGAISESSGSSKDLIFREKNATSDPEIIAEQSNKKKTNINWIPVTSSAEIKTFNKGIGSGSNRDYF